MVDTPQQHDQETALQILQGVPPFASLTPEIQDQLAQKTARKVFPADSFVFRQGEDSRKVLFIIISGLAEITVRNEKGKEAVAGYRRQKEFFGETVVLSNKTYPASARALTNLDCLLVQREDFENLLETNAIFASFFSQLLADRFRSLFQEVALEHGAPMTFEEHAAMKRASELMTYPVVTCFPEERTNEVAKIMGNNHISAVVLTDGSGIVAGLITEKDLVEKVVAEGRQPDALSALEIAQPNPVCISPDSYYYQVLLAMIKKQAKHAIVTERVRPVGIITVRDLIRSRNTGVISVIDRLENQSNLQGLALAGQEIDQILTGLVAENAPIPEILDIISEFYDRLTRRLIELSLNKMLAGYGPPPVKFCWLTMGSSGRREQFLRTDQDNALIYEATSDQNLAKRADRYFAHLSDLIVQGLSNCGFAPCRGYVMAANKLWRGNEQQWRTRVSQWIGKPEKDNIRLLTIFLDFRPVYGEFAMAQELRQFTNKCFSDQSLALKFLAEDAIQGRIPLGFFGHPIGERSKEHKDEINLKKSVAVHLVDCIRLRTLQGGSSATNTLERLQYLRKAEVLPGDFADLLETSFQTVMLFRLRSNLEKLKSGKEPDNYLNLAALDRREKILLRNALKAIDRLVSLTRESFILY